MKIFIKAFEVRFKDIILDYGTNSLESEGTNASTRRMSILEREIFDMHKK